MAYLNLRSPWEKTGTGGGHGRAHVHQKDLLLRKLKGTRFLEDWKLPKAKLNLEQIYEKVTKLLFEAGEDKNLQGISAYDGMYRVQSHFSAHGNLETISRYLRFDLSPGAEIWGVMSKPPGLIDRPAQTLAQTTLHLAQYVFKAFGLPDHFWPPISEKLSRRS